MRVAAIVLSGSAAGTWWLRRRRATVGHFGALQLAIGVLAILILFVFARLPSLGLEELFGGAGRVAEMLGTVCHAGNG
jgi:hypothetical protein